MAKHGVNSMGEPGCIVAFRNDRLGGRLNAILTAMRLSRQYSAPFRVFWALSEGSSPELHRPWELFSKNFISKHFTSREEGSQLLKEARDIGAIPRSSSREAFLGSLAAGDAYLSNAATEQLLLPWENADALSVLPELLTSIEFSPRVNRMIKRINSKLSGLRFRSYHLRRGDIIDDASLASHNLWPTKYIPRVIYEQHMRRELEKGDDLLIVFSDAPEEARAFSEMSPRIRSFSDLIGDAELTVLQRDFLELYTMSRSDYIFAPPSSAFSGLAASLSGKQVTDIEGSLPLEARQEAMDELVQRMEETPSAFLSQSDAGQNLPFVADHLQSHGEPGRAISIAMKYLESGMNRAYLFPFLSERLLAEERYDECDLLIERLGQNLCHREEHWSNVHIHGAMADMIRGNWGRALQRYHSASWFFPINRLVSASFFYLTSMDRLPMQHTWPYDPELMRKCRQIYSSEDGPAQGILNRYLTESGGQPRRYQADMEVRDWRHLHGKKLSFRFSNRVRIIQQADMLLEGLHRVSGSGAAAIYSAAGALLSDAGSHEKAGSFIGKALESYPDHPLYLKRYADHLRRMSRDSDALPILESACNLSEGHPCYLADLALLHQSLGNSERYMDLMGELGNSESQVVELQLLIADALRRKKDLLPEAVARLRKLQELAPGSHRVLVLCARICEAAQRWDEAADALRKLQALGRPEITVRPRLDSLFNAYRRAYDETTARRWFEEQGF